MAAKKFHDELMLEVTVLSAEALKKPSSILFPHRLRPYVTLSTAHHHRRHNEDKQPIYRTRVDEDGAANPTWRDVIRLPINPSFLEREDDEAATVRLTMLSRRGAMHGPAELGWCRILPSDVLDDPRPPGLPRRLSYALRSGRFDRGGRGVVNLSVRLTGPGLARLARSQPPVAAATPLPGGVVMGIPAASVFPLSAWRRAA